MDLGSSPLYRIWVIGGLIGIVAFALIGGLSDPTNQDFILYLIPVIAVWVAGILILQFRGLQRAQQSHGDEAPKAIVSLMRWNVLYAAVLCAAIFAGVFALYAGVDETLYPLGDSGPGLPLVLLPAIALGLYGAVHTLQVLRELFK
ncbi:MAG: hypothetical protein M3M99_07640 [Actinomycetota bacterium]|nr:hypothetical protein [Actinomycetota bacterium]